MIDIKYDSAKVVQDANDYLIQFRVRMTQIANEVMGELYVDCLPHIETDAWTNYREALRIELQHEYKYSKFKEPWATEFRRAVFVENREEISKLIEADILKRIKNLEDCRQEFDQFRYSPGGDTYQDLLAKHERVLQMLEIAEAELKDARDFAMDTLARANQAIETDCDKCDYQCQGCIRAIDDAEAVKYNISIALEKIKSLK